LIKKLTIITANIHVNQNTILSTHDTVSDVVATVIAVCGHQLSPIVDDADYSRGVRRDGHNTGIISP